MPPKKQIKQLLFRPFARLILFKKKLITYQKKSEISDEPEWSLDCSGQGECQPNISPSDGEEKLSFLNNSKAEHKKNE